MLVHMNVHTRNRVTFMGIEWFNGSVHPLIVLRTSAVTKAAGIKLFWEWPGQFLPPKNPDVQSVIKTLVSLSVIKTLVGWVI